MSEWHTGWTEGYASARSEARAEIKKLRAALKPFADLEPEDIDCDGNGEVIINRDDLRVARAAMETTE